MELTEEYKQLTNIDIEEQIQIWDERGKGFYGEYLLFCELYKVVAGNCKILMNLIIPAEFSGTTEIDLLLIHETGLEIIRELFTEKIQIEFGHSIFVLLRITNLKIL